MIKQEIIEKISKYFKLTEYEAEKVYDDIFSIIMTGVKEDNIVDVANFGEFIIKYNNNKSNGNGNGHTNGNGYKKTVEFLASASLEEELNQSIQTSQPQVSEREKTEQDISAAGSSVEEELRKKREEILSKITGPILPIPSGSLKEDELRFSRQLNKIQEESTLQNKGDTVPISEPLKSEKHEEPEVKQEEPEAKQEEPEAKQEEPEAKQEEPKHEEPVEEKQVDKTSAEEVEDLSRKSFSDYFSEVTSGESPKSTKIPVEQPKQEVIPKSAVLLHNEITGSRSQGRIIPEEPLKQQMQPVLETLHETEHKAEDNSYYIWYKDSEPNPTDTQTLTYEYELLYQATKEAEYKSKLRIYVTSFILFFSIVLLLLIFSPVIYKIFFSPEEIQNIENTYEEQPGISEQKAAPNVIQESTTGQNPVTVPPPVDTSAQKKPQVTQQQKTGTEQRNTTQQNTQKQQVTVPPVQKEEKKIQQDLKQQKPLEQAGNNKQQKQNQPPPVESKLNGVTKNSVGWLDEKFKVIYIQLENGKFTIQESAWDSDAKANKRISTVESFGIAGLKGNVVKADLGARGTWFRVRFGEFSTLEEARQKAEELRSKEQMKLHSMLVFLFLYT